VRSPLLLGAGVVLLLVAAALILRRTWPTDLGS
jgi:hypothetical protein